MYNITVVIFTYNEERRIENVIRNFQKFGEILIADNKSTDRTLEIAAAYGCDILIREKDYLFLEDQELADIIFDRITTEWLFWIYSDEIIDKVTLEEIGSLITSDKYDVIKIYRKNYFYGEFCHDLYQSATSRLFKKDAIDFRDNIIHGMGKITVPADRVYVIPEKYFIHQFIDYTAKSYLNATNRYTDIELQYPFAAKKRLWYLFFKLFKNLIKNYFFSRGYKAGFAGLALTELTLTYELVKNIKFYEQENGLTRATIEEKNDVYRTRIIQELEN